MYFSFVDASLTLPSPLNLLTVISFISSLPSVKDSRASYATQDDLTVFNKTSELKTVRHDLPTLNQSSTTGPVTT